MQMLTIVRDKGWYGRFRAAKIMADNIEIGAIKSGETIEIPLPEGTEFLSAKMDWGRSKPFPVGDIPPEFRLNLNAWFSFNPLSSLGITPIPMAFTKAPSQG